MIYNIESTYNRCIREISILDKYYSDSLTLESKFQYLVAEVILLRLFSIMENAFEEIALKLACGSRYRNGALPNLYITCNNISDANNKMISHNRRKPIKLRWTNVNSVNNNINNVLLLKDRFFNNLRNFSNDIEDMRLIRHHIAHRRNDTRNKFKGVISRRLGSSLKISIGPFLTSNKRLTIPLIKFFIDLSKIILNDIT